MILITVRETWGNLHRKFSDFETLFSVRQNFTDSLFYNSQDCLHLLTADKKKRTRLMILLFVVSIFFVFSLASFIVNRNICA